MDYTSYLQSLRCYDAYQTSLSAFDYFQQQDVTGGYRMSSVPMLGTQHSLPASYQYFSSPSTLNSHLPYPQHQVPSPVYDSTSPQQFSMYAAANNTYSNNDDTSHCRYFHNLHATQTTPVSTLRSCARRGCSPYSVHDQQTALLSLSALANSVQPHLPPPPSTSLTSWSYSSPPTVAAAAGAELSFAAYSRPYSSVAPAQQMTPSVETVLRRRSDGMTTSSTESSPEQPSSQTQPTVLPKLEIALDERLPKPRRGGRSRPLSDDAVRILRAWYEAHREHPYIDGPEAAALASQCRLTVPQLRKWLANRRLRTNSTKHIAEVVNRRRMKATARRRGGRYPLRDDQSQQL